MAQLPQDQRQSAFSAGEWMPDLYGRSDLKKYEHAMRRCRNGIILPSGAWANRPGTQFVAETKFANQPVRLIPFVFGVGSGFVLEFGHLYVRFFRDGAAVKSGADLVDYVTPFTSTEVAHIKYAQSGDVIILVHPNHRPQILKRLASDGTSWSLAEISFDRFVDSMTSSGKGPLQFIGPALQHDDSTSTHPPKRWEYCITTSKPSLGIPESKPSAVLSVAGVGGDGAFQLYPDRPVTIASTLGSGGTPDTEVSVYRGRNGMFGLVGACRGVNGSVQFTDEGVMPDYSIQPPACTDPFASLTPGGYPSNVAFYQQRLVFSAGGKIWASALGDYWRFDEYALANDDAAFSFNVASQQYEEIRNFLPMRVMLALTNVKDWTIAGAFSKAQLTLSPNNVRGSAWLDALPIGSTALYVQDGLRAIYEMSYNFAEQSYLGADVTVLAKHFFANHTIKDWAYAQNPNSIVWAVREDGTLLGMTYLHDQDMIAWHWHDTQGTFENVCTVPEGPETATYVVARRLKGDASAHRYIERFASRTLPRIADGTINGKIDTSKGVFLDSSRTFTSDHPAGMPDALTVPTTVFGRLEHLEGLLVGVLADGKAYGPYRVQGGQIDISPEVPAGASRQVTIGLAYDAEGETLGSAIKSDVKAIIKVQFEVVDTRGLWLGPDFNHLRKWVQRGASDAFAATAPLTGVEHLRIPTTFDHEARVVWRVTDPLPVTIVGLTRDLDVGGD